jgi:predicted transcriptional regulator
VVEGDGRAHIKIYRVTKISRYINASSKILGGRHDAMPLPCELAVKSIVPAVRALVAKELRQGYGMKQNDIARLLGVTQSAVSQYARNARGRALAVDQIHGVRPIVTDMASDLATTGLTPRELNLRYCSACRIVRETRVLCDLHRKLDPEFNVEGCDACMPGNGACL